MIVCDLGGGCTLFFWPGGGGRKNCPRMGAEETRVFLGGTVWLVQQWGPGSWFALLGKPAVAPSQADTEHKWYTELYGRI